MSLEIRRSKAPTEKERQDLFGWEEDIFRIDAYGLKWRKTAWSFIGYIEGEPVSHVGVLGHTVGVENHPILVGGIAAVVTLPSARGRGYAHRTLDAATPFLRDNLKAEFGLLFCLDELMSFYGKMGWKKVEDPVIVDQPQGQVVYPMNVMVLPFRERQWPGGRVELNSLPW